MLCSACLGTVHRARRTSALSLACAQKGGSQGGRSEGVRGHLAGFLCVCRAGGMCGQHTHTRKWAAAAFARVKSKGVRAREGSVCVCRACAACILVCIATTACQTLGQVVQWRGGGHGVKKRCPNTRGSSRETEKGRRPANGGGGGGEYKGGGMCVCGMCVLLWAWGSGVEGALRRKSTLSL